MSEIQKDFLILFHLIYLLFFFYFQPFALVAWGCRLQMAKVDSGIARYFIRSKAFRGPESHYLKQGQFSVELIEASNPPSDTNLDKVLC